MIRLTFLGKFDMIRTTMLGIVFKILVDQIDLSSSLDF